MIIDQFAIIKKNFPLKIFFNIVYYAIMLINF